MALSADDTVPPADTSPLVSLRHVSKEYDGVRVVDDVTLDLYAGQTTVLVGPNGSGKTTTMEMLVGLRTMTEGSATIAGIPVTPGGSHRLCTGVQLQSSGLPSGIKTIEVIRSVSCLYADPADWRPMAEMLGVDEYLNSKTDALSGGQRRRLDVLCAALGKPQLLLLDEPSSGVDPEGRARLGDFIRSLSADGCAVLASTHDMAEAESFCDELLVMADARIRLRGSVSEVLSALDGDRRLRIPAPTRAVRQAVESSGRPHGCSGSSLTAIGDAYEIDALTAAIRALPEGDRVELLQGPVRLEDIFAVVLADVRSDRRDAGRSPESQELS